MRAEYGYSGWEINTNVQKLVNAGVNVAEPIGGPASFYADWDGLSNFNGQPFTYKWRCVITKSLIRTLDANGFRVGNGKYAIMGLSSGGGAALTIAAQNRQNFDRAASLSGYNWMTAPGMRTAIRLSMLDIAPAPFNVDAMYGPPWSPRWSTNDAVNNLQGMRGMKIYVGSGNGIVGQHSFDTGSSAVSLFNDVFKGSPLELLVHTDQGLRSVRRHQRNPRDEQLLHGHPLVGLLAGHGLGREEPRLLPLNLPGLILPLAPRSSSVVRGRKLPLTPSSRTGSGQNQPGWAAKQVVALAMASDELRHRFGAGVLSFPACVG